jgi:hypothetical protein
VEVLGALLNGLGKILNEEGDVTVVAGKVIEKHPFITKIISYLHKTH